MRTFIIVSPGLSAGKPGTVVTAAQLHMDDEKLDQFIDVGHAVEIQPETPKKRTRAARSR
jgi:hypothetical protein